MCWTELSCLLLVVATKSCRSISIRKCPRCGGPVIYHGRGRRPVWCSTRCRNEAAIVRRGAREAAVEIRMIDVPKQPRRGVGSEGGQPTSTADANPAPTLPSQLGSRTGAADCRALTAATLADPEAVATVVSALTKLEQMGQFGGGRWAPVRCRNRLPRGPDRGSRSEGRHATPMVRGSRRCCERNAEWRLLRDHDLGWCACVAAPVSLTCSTTRLSSRPWRVTSC